MVMYLVACVFMCSLLRVAAAKNSLMYSANKTWSTSRSHVTEPPSMLCLHGTANLEQPSTTLSADLL
eukprot:6464810-Amphidinium_carterae.2